jgi:hypothetical protein
MHTAKFQKNLFQPVVGLKAIMPGVTRNSSLPFKHLNTNTLLHPVNRSRKEAPAPTKLFL